MTTQLDYKVDTGRVMETIEQLSMITEPGNGNGVTRLAYTKKGAEARNFIERKMKEAGLETRVDAAGNLYGTSNGHTGRELSIASHYDSVPNGGKYDGLLGIAMGIEASRSLIHMKLEHSIQVAALDGEESSRFGISCIGSKLLTGRITTKELKERKDTNGKSAYDAMTELGLKPDYVTQWDNSTIHFHIEPHIEQSDRLLKSGIAVGIVTGIRAPLRYKVTIKGEWAHSGATPMHERKDATQAAFEMGLAVESLANEYEKKGLPVVATVPSLIAEGWAINKVTGNVVIPIDIRGDYAVDCEDLAKMIFRKFKRIALRRGVSIEEARITEKGNHAKLREQDYWVIEEAARALGIGNMLMPSGAGHDAQYVALHGIPTTMLFIRNSGGSHNPKERVMEEDVGTATRLLIESIARADAR